MKTKYVEDDCCYLISNFGTARSPIFMDIKDCEDFKSRVQKHLSPICKILSYGFCNYEFRMVVNLRSREEFEAFYKSKRKTEDEVPDSTYILSQEMANIQSGYALKFNHRHKRKGALFARRFSKRAICSEVELIDIVKKVNTLYTIESYSFRWRYRISAMTGFRKLYEIRERGVMTKVVQSQNKISPILNAKNFLLQGNFKTPSIIQRI